ncbi:ComEC/Rec2 family competence protein [Vitiosangium sp. GDMCC 1.1324]|uniref:ComEC/Rec2 family competence protein n=1 Tax=Vitiosangium sp. (strain GDMCC 1.1324) TaxID=2138576 RepID=UPI000D34094D|nr:ComEC/Rec2 family competence protein [Vitiosangium sp. GDMCC 1.1324]PTL78485.1 MBL fold hydrolase [Vitiosangium sp. GDMCC 1.1324]
MDFVRLLLPLFVLLAALPGRAASSPAPQTPTLKPLTVYFFDVGQGDAALIVSPTGKTVLIDGGPPEADDTLVPRVRQLVQGPLDLVILTHPHLDHLGGLAKVIQAVGARRFMDPGYDHPSESYRKLLDVVGQKVGQVMTPTPNPSAPETLLTIGLGEGVTLTVLSPRAPRDPFLTHTRSDVNANSIVAKLTYGKTAFLFVGDAEPETEESLLKKPIDFTSTVLKVAHHGGRYSSTAPFLAAVKPQAAVISCGAGNDYGHPTDEALERLGAVGARIFRTDLQGEVLAVSNGTTVTLTPKKGRSAPTVVTGQVTGPVAKGPMPTGASSSAGGSKVVPAKGTLPAERTTPPPAASTSGTRYVSLKGSKVFHREDCGTLKRAKTQDRKMYNDRASAVRERRPAEDCDP